MTDEFDIKKALERDAEVLAKVQKNQEELQNSVAKGDKTLGELKESHAKAMEDTKQALSDLREAIKMAGREKIAGAGFDKDSMELKQELDEFVRKDSGQSRFETKAITTGNDPKGGYFINPVVEAGITDLARDMGAIAGLATSSTIGTKEWQKFIRMSGMAARRIAEGTTGGESSTPTYGNIKIAVHDAEVEPRIHTSTLEDMDYDIVGELNSEAAYGFAELLANEVLNGSGVGECSGILQQTMVDNASYAWGKLGFVKSGASGAFAASNPADKLIALQHSLRRQYRPRARFVMNDATLAEVRMMKDGSGQYYLWQADPTAGFAGRVLGSPIEIDDYMPDMASNSFSIIFGDIAAGYRVVRRRGISLIRDPYTQKGQILFNMTTRFGGGVQNYEAIKLMKFAA